MQMMSEPACRRGRDAAPGASERDIAAISGAIRMCPPSVTSSAVPCRSAGMSEPLRRLARLAGMVGATSSSCCDPEASVMRRRCAAPVPPPPPAAPPRRAP
jgi:hypothetical protein